MLFILNHIIIVIVAIIQVVIHALAIIPIISNIFFIISKFCANIRIISILQPLCIIFILSEPFFILSYIIYHLISKSVFNQIFAKSFVGRTAVSIGGPVFLYVLATKRLVRLLHFCQKINCGYFKMINLISQFKFYVPISYYYT